MAPLLTLQDDGETHLRICAGGLASLVPWQSRGASTAWGQWGQWGQQYCPHIYDVKKGGGKASISLFPSSSFNSHQAIEECKEVFKKWGGPSYHRFKNSATCREKLGAPSCCFHSGDSPGVQGLQKEKRGIAISTN